jgi:hypothetical protein
MIDRDEDGYPDPFYMEALPCESCGKPIEGERHPAIWDTDLMVGECCRVEEIEVPQEIRCRGEYDALMAGRTVGEMVDAVRKHRASCPVCQGARKGIQREVGARAEWRGVA